MFISNKPSKVDLNVLNISYKKKAVEATKQKEERRKKPKPEEQEGMPQQTLIKSTVKASACYPCTQSDTPPQAIT
jgi:hypothetical protein